MNDEETDRLVRVGLMMATLISETLERADDKLVAAYAKSAALMIQLDAASGDTVSDACNELTVSAALWATLGSPKAPVTLVEAARRLVMERDANVAQDAHVRCLVGARDGETTATAVRRALGAYRKSAVDGDLAGPTT